MKEIRNKKIINGVIGFVLFFVILFGGFWLIDNLFTKELKAQEINNVNLASPDLENKEYLGNGIYRLYNDNGITINYNVYNGVLEINGTVTGTVAYSMLWFTNTLNEYRTLSIRYVSGMVVSGINEVGILNNGAGAGIPIRNNTYLNPLSSQTKNNVNQLLIYIANGAVLNNYKFTLQLEKGETVTNYQVPIETLKQHIQFEKNNSYNKGYDDAYDYDNGYDDGYDDGFESGINQSFKAVALDSNIMTWETLPVVINDNNIKITSSKIYIRDHGLQGIAVDLNIIDDFIRDYYNKNYGYNRGILVSSQHSFVEFDNSYQRSTIGADLIIDNYRDNVNEGSYFRIQLSIPIVNSSQNLQDRENQRNQLRSYMNELLIRDNIIAGFIYRKGAETNIDDFLGLFDAYFKKGQQQGSQDGYNNGRNEFGYNHNGVIVTGPLAFDLGYDKGLIDNPNNNFGSMISTILLGVGTVLGIELLPNITIGAIIAVPIVFGIIAFVLGRKKE